MANIHILGSPASDIGTYSGGSWAPTLPLSNLVARPPTQVARTTDLTANSTRFIVDLRRQRPIGLFGLINHNCSGDATIRYRVSDVADGSNPTLDATRPARRPNLTWGGAAWEEFAWDGYQTGIEPGGPIALYKPAAVALGRYVLIDIADASNPAGYIQIGRAMIGLPFVPRFNMNYGAAFGLIDDSRLTRSIGGQLWTDVRSQRRKFTCSFEALSEAEAQGQVYDIQRRCGLIGGVLVVYDPDDAPGTASRRTLYGTLTNLADIVTANASVDAPYTWSLSVEELI